MNSKLKKILKWIFLYPLVVLICFEVSLRIIGHRPFYNTDYKVEATPKNAYIGDPDLGIRLTPGSYSIVLNQHVKFTATHLENGRRFVSDRRGDVSICMLGCSFTYGYGVDDDSNFVAILQRNYPKEVFGNYGVIGYGTVQSYIQLKEILAQDHLPKQVLLNFSTLHFMRNTMEQQYRSNLRVGYRHSSKDVDARLKSARFPYMSSCNGQVEYVAWGKMYSNWFGRDWLAMVNWFQSGYDNYRDGQNKSTDLTAYLINEMNRLCQEKKVVFNVVFLDSNAQTQALKPMLKDVDVLEVSFDFNNRDLTNLPYDSHPNSKGHLLIAQKIKTLIQSGVDE